ncbi:MAG: hypothetical protein EBX40_00520 [Gammaproteobacteria bacterium]|nr:hypothetical protein [Gammaproteobacteria bacterium]
MYSLNTLDRFVLISPDEVVKRVNFGGVIDPHVWLNAIEIAEERFIRPTLGYEFYEALIAEKNTTVTSGNLATLQAFFNDRDITLVVGDIVNALELFSTASYATLWKERLWKYTAECVYAVALPEKYVQFTESGIVKNNPAPAFIGTDSKGDAVGADLKDLKYLVDVQITQRLEPLRKSLIDFLCRNKAGYPLWDSTGYCGDNKPAPGRIGTFITGIYNDRKPDERNYVY